MKIALPFSSSSSTTTTTITAHVREYLCSNGRIESVDNVVQAQQVLGRGHCQQERHLDLLNILIQAGVHDAALLADLKERSILLQRNQVQLQVNSSTTRPAL